MSQAASGNLLTRITGGWRGNLDVSFAIFVIAIMSIMLLPLPPFILDMGLTMAFAVSVLILMVALWVNKGVEFSSFPTILLVITMLRLALNIATTRAILTNGENGTAAAGHVIEGFATFVMGGNMVVGFVIFSILLIVNFVVITKGSGRIAEVSARFFLDGIPGRQMAIDADLSSGAIDEAEANRRRAALEEESGFYGAMDGAAKFVRGDAVAGLMITGINLIGGIIIGVVFHGMSFADATRTYTIMTVGDGLVTQVPALLVSLAAGLLISKGSTKGSVEKAVFSQLGSYPKALWMASGLLLLLSVAPAIPFVPFFLLSAALGSIAYYIPRRRQQAVIEEGIARAQEEKPVTAEDTVQDQLHLDEVRLELGAALVPMISAGESDLAQKLKTLRGRFAQDFGFVLPSIRIKDSIDLGHNEYRLLIKGVTAARGEVRPGLRMAMAPNGGQVPFPGERAKDPTFGLDVTWIDPALAEQAEAMDCTVISPEGVIVTHVAEAVKDNLDKLLSYAATQRLINTVVEPEYQALVKDLIPARVTVASIMQILQGLLAERVSVRNLSTILEAIAEAVAFTNSVPRIIEHVRFRLADAICETLSDGRGNLPVITLSPDWETKLAEHMVGEGDARQLRLPPDLQREFVGQARKKIEAHAHSDTWPAIIVSPDARPQVRMLVNRISMNTPVISYGELARNVRMHIVDTIGVG